MPPNMTPLAPLLEDAHAEVLPDGRYRLSWRRRAPAGKIRVFAGDSPENIDMDSPVAVTQDEELFLPNTTLSQRRYFYLQPERGPGTRISERCLRLEGASNFRDLGGYRSADGRYVRWGRIYRSGQLSALTDTDRRYLHSLGIELVCDFRHPREQRKNPSALHRQGLRIESLSITPGSSAAFYDSLHKEQWDSSAVEGIMCNINRELVRHHSNQYRKLLQGLLDPSRRLLFHCAAGKDRTGLAAALILAVLEVPRDTILKDYLLSNRFLEIDKFIQRSQEYSSNGERINPETLRPFFEVRPAYLEAAFEEIERSHSSLEHYLRQTLGIDSAKRARLQENLLIHD